MFVKVLLPLYLNEPLLYAVPQNITDNVKVGIRVTVPLGVNKLYSGIVIEICENQEVDFQSFDFQIKEVVDIIDKTPVTGSLQLDLWTWISEYYMCTLGEVMKAALPACMKLESETKIALNPDVQNFHFEEQNMAFRLIINSLSDGEMSVKELKKKTGIKKIFSFVKELLDSGTVKTEAELETEYNPKYQSFITLHHDLYSEEKLVAVMDSLKKGSKQKKLLTEYIEAAKPLNRENPVEISKAEFLAKNGISSYVYKSCEEKKIFISIKKPVERIPDSFTEQKELPKLSPPQQKAFEALSNSSKPALLFGVTSSGKTEIYIHLINSVLKQNRQILYLLPEIALTTQIIGRLRAVFGEKATVYHSKFNDFERYEIYNKVLNLRDKDDKSHLVLGVRSSLLLPFDSLGLIIVDEEHENTYKQFDPAPRYNARDAALIAGRLHGAKIVLGSATPSLESYYNARTGKYELVELTERYGSATLPEIRTINMKRAYWRKKIISSFSETLVNEIKDTLQQGEQIILFQNRRGYSPFIQCHDCGMVVKCKYCDVSMTYHKFNNMLSCHYCGYSLPMPLNCPSCRGTDIKAKGLGTEKIEDELSILFPEASIERLDMDTAKSKFAYEKILNDFGTGKIDILVGTQMIAKGLDFANVGLVGIVNADLLLNFPDFRAYERSFQLISQVGGRAGRKDKKGRVFIQTLNPENQIIRQVVNNDFKSFFETQIQERRLFNYPPFCRLIMISIRHSNRELLNEAAVILKTDLAKTFDRQVSGPEPPPVGRVQNKFILNFRIKIPKDNNTANYKQILNETFIQFKSVKQFAGIMLIADVDPY
ncbi:MAG: primosomal protein N' [Prevotellaceae bacterium]|nr:primosomal protein N' [Prevotellaceae bacterium]